MAQRRPFLYLIGPPGSGKTTTLNRVLPPRPVQIEEPVAHMRYEVDGRVTGAQLGRARAVFGGTDVYPYNIRPRASSWLASIDCDYPALVAEGDRLTSETFFQSIVDAGWELHVLYCLCGPRELARRRDARGSKQSPAWMKGRETKARKFAARWRAPTLWMEDTARAERELAEHPVIRALTGA